MIIDPNSGHSVIFREVHASDVSLRGEVLLSFGGNRHYAVSALVGWLDRQPIARNGVTLKAFGDTSSTQENSVAG